MPSAHARLSPSASGRWIKCPGSIKMTAELPDRTNSAAKRGTIIHQIGEDLLNGKNLTDNGTIDVPEFGECSYDAEMFEEAGYYVQYVEDRYKYGELVEKVIEMKVDLTDIAPDTFGHADAVLLVDSTLHVIDLKTGAQHVTAVENSQLKLYAYGAYKELCDFYDITDIEMHIVQNNSRAGLNTSYYQLSPDKLVDWVENVVKPAAKEALSDDPKCVPGEVQCRWCAAASFCPEAMKKAEAIVDDLFHDLDNNEDDIKESSHILSIDKIVNFLDKFKFIEGLSKSYQDRIFKELSDGKDVEGYKLVKKQTRKKWVDEITAYEKLKTWVKLDEIAPRKLLTPTAAEKLLGEMSTKKKNVFNELWVKPESDLTIAPESDKREAVKPVVEGFDNLDDDFLS